MCAHAVVCVCGSSWVYLGLGIHSFIPLFSEPGSVPGLVLCAGNTWANEWLHRAHSPVQEGRRY